LTVASGQDVTVNGQEIARKYPRELPNVMKIFCTRPGCSRPNNDFTDLDDHKTLKTVQQKYCTTCGMPLILDGRYLPQKLLGQGGFGAAFLALDRRSPGMRECVVKQFQPAGDLSPQQMELALNLFEREAVVLDNLGRKHPAIPDLLAYFPLEASGWQGKKSAQYFYLVQEFIDGQNLEEELAQKGQLSAAEVLEVLKAILDILKFVHGHDVIHRDIKPSNIMRDRNSGRLFLLDFGAVKQVTQAAASGGVGRSTGIYSMGFAPPEQMAGRSVFPSTDLYALAVTCIMLLTGKPPQELFDSYSNQWDWRKYLQVSNLLGDVLDKMLLPTPSDRYASAEQVLGVLDPPIPKPPIPKPPIPQPQAVNPTITPTPTPAPTPAVNPQPTVNPTPSNLPVPVQPTPPPSPVKVSPIASQSGQFSTLEVLTGAAFSGFEGALLLVAIGNLIKIPAVSTLLWLGVLAGLFFAQNRRIIEKYDLLIIALISLAIVFFIPPLRGPFPGQLIILYPLFGALCATAVTALFRLVYKFLSQIL
jgi:serine/threonine protein kinase